MATNNREVLNVQYRTTGFDALEEALKQLGDDFGYGVGAKKVLVPAVREAMRPCLTTARAFILSGPYNEQNTTSKHMVDTLKLTARQPNSKDKKSAYIDVDDVAMAMVSVYTDDRGMSQEFGNARVPAQPFLRRSLEFSASACIDQLEMILGRKIQEYRAKQTKDKT
jgi:hypothetical protein